ncbi:hypothetical protein INS49_005714 [Diaporthe citri]|uniref:uncharacterized protein n=1 Tax=Diaporthe citri TaxID=83186 RepID=UPI001C7FE84F|nr:uncharacterized protein INS49_005714 [Diaporthe citri]KAG6364116.1 hypothetical protein INS49_005714 [Diaporthe citri]
MEDVQLPVGVWIHGGAHITGSNRDAQYNMSFIVEQSVAAGKPFIGVNLNCRLQLYGFMYGSDFVEAGSGDLGYKDQHLALRWLRENIAAFCGDLVWHATRRLTAETWARNGVPGWSYLFNVLPVGVSGAVGVTHFLEVAYVFSNVGAAAPEEHTRVANLMSRYWAGFIADLDPNSGKVGPDWPAYSLAEPQLMAFDVNSTALATPIADTYREEQIQYINDNLGPLGRK